MGIFGLSARLTGGGRTFAETSLGVALLLLGGGFIACSSFGASSGDGSSVASLGRRCWALCGGTGGVLGGCGLGIDLDMRLETGYKFCCEPGCWVNLCGELGDSMVTTGGDCGGEREFIETGRCSREALGGRGRN